MQYYVNDALVFTATLPAGQIVDAISYQFDAYATSFYADNVVISTNVVSVAATNNAIVNGVTITDLNGRIVKTAAFKGMAEAQVNIAELSVGIYMMNIASDKGTVTKKIIKQ